MKFAGKRRAQPLIVVGMVLIALATAALSRFQNDYLIGLGFGAGIGLLLLRLFKFRTSVGMRRARDQ